MANDLNKDSNLRLYLCPGVFFTDGAKFASILDSNKRNLYRINYSEKETLKQLISEDGSAVYDSSFVNIILKKGLVSFEKKELPPESKKSNNHRLTTVWLELKKTCNLECLHCYNCSNPLSEKGKNALTEDDWEKIIMQLLPYKPKTIVLIGGEPLLYKEINKLMSFIRETLFETTIVLYSNLTLLTDEIISNLSKLDVKVVTSIYGASAEVHDMITQRKGSFEKTVTNVSKLKESGISVKANTVIMSLNEDELQNTKSFIKQLTSKEPKTDVVRCNHESIKYLEPTCKIKTSTHYISSTEKFSNLSKERFERCLKGNSCFQGKLNITFDGYVLPCIMCSQNEKDLSLKNYSLDTILNQYFISKYWNLSKDYIDICQDCEYRYICADCRPLAKSLYSRGECAYNPYLGKWNVTPEKTIIFESSLKVNAKPNDSKIAFVFSCPGKLEMETGILCAGETGNNLDKLLIILHRLKPNVFFGKDRNDYFITNASNCVHYSELTNDSEAPDSELSMPDNLFRLKKELQNRTMIICCGKKAKKAVKKIEKLLPECNIVFVNHLGKRGLQSVSGMTDDEKLVRIAHSIINQSQSSI